MLESEQRDKHANKKKLNVFTILWFTSI